MAQGYVRHRKGNTYQLEVNLGSYIDPATKKRKRNRKYKTIEAKGITEARIELARFISEVTGEGYYEAEKMFFVDFVYNEWLPKHAKRQLSHTTLENYLGCLKRRIIPVFQYLRLDQVKPIHIIDFIHNLEEDGMRLDGKKGKLSSAQVHYHYRVLNNIFNFAVQCGLLKESPVKKVDKPKVEHKESEVYSLEETSKLLKCLEEENHVLHWQIIVKLAITTGMRRSELFGLEFKHFDFDKRTLYVRQALTYTKEQGYQVYDIKKGNNSANQRKITLSEALIEPIKQLELQRKKERLATSEPWEGGKYNFLLADKDGKPYNPESLKNWWRRFIDRHKLTYINIHALRHTSATLLINEGVHAKIISERLGHADINTTMNIYGHALKEADEIATNKLDAVLFNSE